MRLIILLFMWTSVILVASETYTDRYDAIDIDEILENKKLLIPYLNCILERGKCTPDGKELKLHIKDAVQTDCQRCTMKQRRNARKVIKYVKAHEDGYWDRLKDKFDPEDKFKPTYEAFLERDD